MQSIARAMPVKPGTGAEMERLVTHLAEEAHERMAELGVRTVRIWHQTAPMEAIVVYVEAEDFDRAHAARARAEHPAEGAVDGLFESITGHHTRAMRGVETKLLLDWHHERGRRAPGHTRHAQH
jgi:hypothetical protein